MGFESPPLDSEVGTDTNTDKDLSGVETMMKWRVIISNNTDSGSSPQTSVGGTSNVNKRLPPPHDFSGTLNNI